MRRAAKVDENQPSMVAELRARGFSVQSLAAVGDGCPDLVVARRGLTVLVEVKNPSKPPSARRLTEAEQAWHERWSGALVVALTVDDVLAVFRGLEAGGGVA